MYYKAFVLLRLPVSVLCLCGFGLLNVWQEPGMGLFGFMVVVGLLVFLGSLREDSFGAGAGRSGWRGGCSHWNSSAQFCSSAPAT